MAEPAGLWIAKDAGDGTLVVRCEFDFKDGGPVERRVRFLAHMAAGQWR